MAIITYEGTMLGAIIFTVLGIIFESRLPRPKLGLYDERITAGYVGILVTTTEDRFKAAKEPSARPKSASWSKFALGDG